MERSVESINLVAGDLLVVSKPDVVVTTILGSCVTVIFYVPGKITMVCHALLPSIHSYDGVCIEYCPSPCHNPLPNSSEFRYVTCSLKYMLSELKKRQIPPSQVYTYLIGGSNILQNRDQSEGIGFENVRMAKEILNRYGFVIRREHTGGLAGRNLRFYVNSNTLIIKVHGSENEFELGDSLENSAEVNKNSLEQLLIEVQKLNK